jgi:hypothetical protein
LKAQTQLILLKEDAMYETAKQLMDTAVNTHMQMHGVDRETARYWVAARQKLLIKELRRHLWATRQANPLVR